MPEAPLPSDDSTPSSPESSEKKWSEDEDMEVSAVEAPDAAEPPQTETLTQEEWEENADWEEDPIEEVASSSSTFMSTQEALSWLQPLWRQAIASWRRLLAGLRARVPATARLSDAVLSGILIGGLVLLLVLFNGVRQPSIASQDSSEGIEQSDYSTEDLDVIEGDRIAEIQTQLISGSLSEDSSLIESVEADFKRDRLTVNLSDDWYDRPANEQEDIAEELLERSLELSFKDLELRSSEGDLLARSPVVGKAVVVLQREESIPE